MDVMERQESVEEKSGFRRWFWKMILGIVGCLLAGGAFVVYVDPFFHYHAPLKNFQYPLMRENERYQTDGILRNWDYDAIIIGTSMTECFNTSDLNYLFGVNSVKTPLAGGLFKEMNDNLERAFTSENDIKMVVRSFEYQCIAEDKDATKDIYDYAEYMTNDNPFDDAPYLFNKEVLGRAGQVLVHTARGLETTSFNEYANWMDRNYFGAAYVYLSYDHTDIASEPRMMTEEERIMIKENLQQNVVALAKQHPDTTFYVYFPPYSIGYWDQVCNKKELDWHLEMEKIAMEEVLKCPNIKLYSYSMREDWILNLDNYCDLEHHAEWINYGILVSMAADEGLLTQDNYMEYLERERDFFGNFDYEAFWEGQYDAF